MITKELELPTEEIIKEMDDSRKFSFIGSSETSSELQTPTKTPKIGSAYYPFFYILHQQLAGEEELKNEQFVHIKNLTDYYNRLLYLIHGRSWNETLSNYPILDLRVLERLYILRREDEVIKFLVGDPFLFPLLPEAYDKIRNYFEESSKVSLEVVTDPEVAEDQELLISIHTKLPPDEAFKRLLQFDEEWWLNTPADARKKICIDLDYE